MRNFAGLTEIDYMFSDNLYVQPTKTNIMQIFEDQIFSKSFSKNAQIFSNFFQRRLISVDGPYKGLIKSLWVFI